MGYVLDCSVREPDGMEPSRNTSQARNFKFRSTKTAFRLTMGTLLFCICTHVMMFLLLVRCLCGVTDLSNLYTCILGVCEMGQFRHPRDLKVLEDVVA